MKSLGKSAEALCLRACRGLELSFFEANPYSPSLWEGIYPLPYPSPWAGAAALLARPNAATPLGEPKTRRMCRKSRFGGASGVILGALAFRRTLRMRSGVHLGTLRTPKSMLPSRREHRFQKISVSAIYLNFGLKITSQTNLLDAAVALKTRPKRLKSAPTRSPRRFLAVFGVSWGALGCLWAVFERSGRSWAHPRASSGAIFKAFCVTCFLSLLH